MIKSLDPKKQYKVSGKMLHLILELSELYNIPLVHISSGYCEQGNKILTENVTVVPFPSEKRDYLIGCLVQEFNNCDWEEV